MISVNLAVDELSLIRGKGLKVNPYITVRHPTLGEIVDFGELRYLQLVSVITSTPSDHKVELFDAGIDYGNISDLSFFISQSRHLDQENSHILFGDFDFSKCVLTTRKNDDPILCNIEGEVLIDEAAHIVISDFIRKINLLKKHSEKPANAATRTYLIERDRAKQRRNKDVEFHSELKSIVSALVNSCHFKYDYKTIWDMPIYAFNDSIRQVQKLINYELLMGGVYSGTVDSSKLNISDLSWIEGAKR